MSAGHPFSWLRRAPFWLRGLLFSVPIFMVWLATFPTPTRGERVLEVGFLTLLQAVTAWTLWRASKRLDLLPGQRQAIRWLTLAFATMVMASLTFPFTLPYQNQAVNLGLPDLFYLAAYPITFLGLTKLPKASPPLPGFWRVLLDSAAFIVGVGVPIWFFAMQPTLARSFSLSTFLTIVYPAFAFIGVMVLNSVLLRAEPFPSRAALNLLLAAIGISWLADIMFAIELTQLGSVIGLRYWVNNSNALSLVLALAGSWRMLADPPPAQHLRPATVSPVPMLTIVLVSLFLLPALFAGSIQLHVMQKVLAGVLLLIFVLLLRETLALRETSRQAAEAATAQSQARFEVLVRHSSDLILVLNHQGVVTFASPAVVKIIGIEADSMSGNRLADFLHPEDLEATRTFLQDLLIKPDTLIHQCRIRHTDGSWRVLEISASNLIDDPTVHGLVLNARDITERHRLEDQLREAQKMEAVGRLAGGVAHDFNNLLSAILGNAELAEAHLPEGHPAGRDLKRIYGAATRGAALTGRLLAFCRRDSPESKTINPAQLLKGVTPLLEGLLGERIRLVLDIDRRVWPITIDPNELEQALLNMAANARDAMPDGGRLTVAVQNLTIPVAQVTPYLPIAAGEAVALDVTDSGTGMDEATLKHLFEPFFTTKARGKGTGLGLASVYGLVKGAQGGIDVRSTPGQGTTIRLVFPRANLPLEEPDTDPGAQPIQGSETILLVEDELSVRETTHRLLAANGYAVLSAGNADEARSLLRSLPGAVHLLLTDVIMPGDSGPTLAAELVGSHPGLRVLYMSGYTADELGPHGLARPDAPLLRKPFTVGQLTRHLRAVLAGPPGRI